MVESRLRVAGATFERLSIESANKLWQQWREAFARPVRQRRGTWTIGEYHWHGFSYGDVPAVALNDATRAYEVAWRKGLNAQHQRGVFVLPSEDEDLAYSARASGPLNFTKSDTLVVPTDFSWTMAFTHEDGWIGPFFSEAAWQQSTAEMRSWQSPPRVKR